MSESLLCCPACKSPITPDHRSDGATMHRAPRFCPSCGIHLHRSCPACGVGLTALTRFCPDCGKEIHASNGGGEITAIAVKDITSAEYLARLRKDAADSCRLVREVLLVLVRLNPIHVAAHRFCEIINTITPDMPRPAIAEVTGQALEESQGAFDPDAMENWRSGAAGSIGEFVSSCRNSLDKCGLPWQQHIDHEWILDPEPHAVHITHELEKALSSNLSDVGDIQRHYLQLTEFYPRYRDVMSRTGILDYVIGFGAAFFGGPLGLIGAHVWDDWRNKSDSEFLQAFAAAVDQFTHRAFDFIGKTEAAVTPVADQFVAEMGNQMESVVNGLGILAGRGHSLRDIFHALHYSEEPADESGAEFIELVIANLRSQGLSYESERNIREMCGLGTEAS